MTRVVQGNRPIIDPADAAYAAERREALASNETYQRNINAAQSEFAKNQVQGFQDQLGRLKRAHVNRDVNDAGRQHYDLVHRETIRYAERVAEITGQPQRVPKYEPRPNVTVEYEVVKARPYDPGYYAENKDKRNLPAGSIQPRFDDPASNEHQNWLSLQGAAPVADDPKKTPNENLNARRRRAGALEVEDEK